MMSHEKATLELTSLCLEAQIKNCFFFLWNKVFCPFEVLYISRLKYFVQIIMVSVGSTATSLCLSLLYLSLSFSCLMLKSSLVWFSLKILSFSSQSAFWGENRITIIGERFVYLSACHFQLICWRSLYLLSCQDPQL
jgi:hypothetical protein